MEKIHFFLFSVKYPFKVASASDRPVNRAGTDSKHFFNLIQKLVRISCLTVKLIDESENGDMTHHANLEELNRLRLHTLCSVNDHDRTVGCHKRPIGILREILVSRRVQDIDASSVIIKLQNGRSNGNPSLLLNFHPVRNRMLCRLSSLYGSRKIYCPSIEKKFLRQGRFTRIGVRNNRKGSSLLYFFS